MDNASPFPLEPALRGAHVERRDRGGLRRMRDMRFAEIAYRGWQEASRWLERVAPAEQDGLPEELLRKQAPELADPEAALRCIRDTAPRRFFAGAEDHATRAALAERLSAECGALVASADTLDSRVVWELNRHQGLVRLAQVRVLTGDERYAQACVRAIDAWLDAHPPGVGAHWAASVDVSLRLMSWCWTLLLLRDSPVLHGARVHKLLASIWLHATHVRRYLSHYCSKNTDLTAEALGLFYAATLFPEFRDAERWRDVAVRILVAESETQVYSDGVHFEQSTCHHRYTLDTYLQFMLLASRNGVSVPGHVADRIGRMVEFLLAVRQPDGTIPSIGDDDGGTMLPLAERASGDSRGLFAVAAAIFGRRDFAWAAEGLAPEVLWLMGTEGASAFDGLEPAPPASAPSRVFPSGGYAVMRSGWNGDAHQMIVDIGPIGCPVSGGHGHADLLSLQCAIFGEPCLVDAGTARYSDGSPWRDFFRSTSAHSTVIVDGASQATPEGAFGWRQQPRVRLREWHSTPEFDFLDAEHDGYLSLPDPVVHRRRVIFVKPGYWIVVDDLSGAARHQVDVTFQFGALDVTLATHPWARAETPNGRVLWISSFPFAPVQPSLKSGELSPISGWISRDYGERQPAPMLIYSYTVALPWRILTLLLPDRQGGTTPPAARAIHDAAGLPTGVAFERPRRVVRFDDQAVSVDRE
jgi:uncharacterized heparinase superfamily protein